MKQSADIAPPGPISPDAVLDELHDLALELTTEQSVALATHANLMIDANTRMNLTRVIEPSAVLRLHILDSALAFPAVELCPDGPVADIGSGAGYPGVVLAIIEPRHMVLVESVGKKAAFLSSVVEALELDAEVESTRAEELALRRPAEFACVVARAVSSLPSLVELASPLLLHRGRLICMKGAPSPEELERAGVAARLCGMRLMSTQTFLLPGGESRSLVVYERHGSVQLKLPRRAGLAQRTPLAESIVFTAKHLY